MSSAEISIMVLTFILQMNLIKQRITSELKLRHVMQKQQRILSGPQKGICDVEKYILCIHLVGY